MIFKVKDVNDQTPKFSADSYVAKVALDATVESQVLLVVATDLDSGDNGRVVYNITRGNDEGAFKIDPDTGVVKVKKSLTTVSASRFTLEVEAKDKGNPALRKLSNVQLDVFLPDGPPKFVVKPVVQEVTEGIKANNKVMVVKAAASEALTYEIISGNEDGLFRIVPSTGEILVTRELDYEQARERRLVIRVMDTRDRSDQVTVILQIKNINDNAPKFPGEAGGFVERKVEDNFQIGDAVARLSAFDGDAGDTITYTLSSDAQSSFSIDKNGFLIAKKPRKDFSSPVTFQLTAKDSGSPPRESKVEVQLVLVSYRPEQEPVREYIREDKEVGSVVAIVPRYFPGGTLSIIYPRKSNFTVDNSGRVRMTASFDFEAKQFYTLTVREQEPAPLSRTNDVDVEINVIDINDNKPKMKMVDYFGRVNTNSRPGTSAYQLKAEDKDGGLSGRIGYQMVSRGIPFAINPLTDVVETGGVLQDRGGYNVTLIGFDFGIPRQFGDSVYLDIKTVNFKPQFSDSSYKFEVFENDLPGKVIGVVNATSASGARLGFSIVQGDSDNKFSIGSTGKLTVNSMLDRETKAINNLKVRTTEQIPRGYSNDVDVQILVRNANEHYPYFSKLVYERSIDEGVGAGAAVLRAVAYDCDCPACACPRGELTYSLEGTSLFKIDKVTGDISVGDSPLDYGTRRQHLFKVVVKDFGEKKFSSRSFVRLTIQNVNDEKPKFHKREYSVGIAEDAPTNKALAAILARDVDGDSANYSITSGNGGNIFNINPTTGVLSLRQSVQGKQTQYSLQVRATDPGNRGRYDEVRVVVNIEDINDNRPSFTVCPPTVTVKENQPRGERVTQVTAVDKDRGRNGEVEYKLGTGGERLFEINNSTGLITTITSLDRETEDRHTLIVQAEDGGHGRNEAERLLSYCIIEVKVDDMNDNYPVFFTRKYFGSVFQKAALGTTALTVSASDADIGNNQKVVYSLVGSNDKFKVDGATGIITTIADLSNFQQTVLLKIKASNQATPTNAAKTSLSETTVEINVENQQPPKFQPNSIYNAAIKEDVKVGTSVVTVKAVSQVDSQNVISYRLVKSYPDAEQKFQVHPGTGVISTASALNFEQQNSYKLQIRARENINNLYATCTVNITLEGVNNDTLTFKLEEYSARVPENAVGDFNVITVKADDRDTGFSGQVIYSLDASQDFRIFSSNGTIFTKTSFDREVQKSHNVLATATDRGSPSLTAKVAVSVAIVDQNDKPPVFAQRKYEGTVQEDAPKDTSIRDLTATDADIGDNARLDYFISGGDQSQLFRMETVYSPRNIGILYLDGKLDFESKSTYTIKVTATDRKNSDTVDVVITVSKSSIVARNLLLRIILRMLD